MSGVILDASIQMTLGIAGIILNMLQLIILLRKQRRPFESTLLSLSIADLLVSVCLILNSVLNLLREHDVDFDLSDIIYRSLRHAIYCFAITLALLHIIFIALQRLIAVMFPFRVHELFSKRRCCFFLAVMWVGSLGFLTWSVWAFTKDPDDDVPLIAFSYVMFLAEACLIPLYAAVCCLVVRRGGMAANASTDSRNHSVILYSVIITAFFVVMTFPLGVLTCLSYVISNPYLKYSPKWLLFIDITMNPVIYFFFNHWKSKKYCNFRCCVRRDNRTDIAGNTEQIEIYQYSIKMLHKI